jgi:hypothetical protein
MANLIVPTRHLGYAQKVIAEAEAKRKGTNGTTEEPANRGSLQANLNALGECQSPEEQKALIFRMLPGNYLKRLRPAGNRLLVITYVAPQVSKGGVRFIDKRGDSNRFEGKTGLLIAIGPTAFKYDGSYEWEGEKPGIGDWIWYRASDAPERGYCNIYGRTIFDDLYEGICEDPSDVW